MKLIDAIVLPPAISEFERAYLTRMNRIVLWFFITQLPAFIAIAWLNDTGPGLAAALTVATLAVPLAASKAFDNPRHISIAHGFTSMLMGGILVHVGQGPIQIEMHFYFFVLLALLAVFANPMVIVVAAGTVAVHHLLLWYTLPASVFNYDAPLWVVLVHAAFVVLESVAACFIARSFFDNVIGLEKKIAERTAELDSQNRHMRVVLDNVSQGLLTLMPDGSIAPGHSSVLARWLGHPEPKERFSDYLAKVDPNAGALFTLGLEELHAGEMPAEVTLAQLPSRLQVAEREIEIAYERICDAGVMTRMLVVFTDVTDERQRERLEAEQRDMVRVVQRIVTDRQGFLEFYDETEQNIASLEAADQRTQMRILHTLKGNAALFGLQSLADLCHGLESSISETAETLAREHLDALLEAWARARSNLLMLLGQGEGSGLHIDDIAYEHVLRAVLIGEPRERVAEMIRAWKLEPTATRLRRLAVQADGLAKRLGKEGIEVEIEDANVRVSPNAFREVWSTFAHLIRNAVDHGIESSDHRVSNGKDAHGHLRFETRLVEGNLEIRIADDGRGIDWEVVRQRAMERGLPCATPEDLTRALFEDGLSTAESVSDVSGRGVGMSAVRAAVEEHGGSMTVESTVRRGTEVSIRLPVTPETAWSPKNRADLSANV